MKKRHTSRIKLREFTISMLSLDITTKELNGKTSQFFEATKIPLDKTQFKPFIAPEDKKAKMNQLQISLIKLQRYTNIFKSLFNKIFCKR